MMRRYMTRAQSTPAWRPIGLCAGLLVALARPAAPCDLHALRTASAIADDSPGLRLGVAEQWTHYGTLQDGDDEIGNPDDQRLDSSITQLVAGYRFTERLGVELRLPVISRHYRRPTHDGGIEDGSEAGFGDLALLADVVAFRRDTDTSSFRVNLVGGLELPSGNPDHLGDELEEHHHSGADAETESGIHGHDLALGSGSVDGLLGLDLFWSRERAFFLASLFYAIRGEGAFDYRYANDLQWAAGPGVLVWRGAESQVAVQALVSGESKGQDEQQGETLNDTAATTLYVGPGFNVGWKRLEAEATVEVPVVTHRTAVQIAPDVRVRGGLRWRF
jgi:hypothetical protein